MHTQDQAPMGGGARLWVAIGNRISMFINTKEQHYEKYNNLYNDIHHVFKLFLADPKFRYKILEVTSVLNTANPHSCRPLWGLEKIDLILWMAEVKVCTYTTQWYYVLNLQNQVYEHCYFVAYLLIYFANYNLTKYSFSVLQIITRS